MMRDDFGDVLFKWTRGRVRKIAAGREEKSLLREPPCEILKREEGWLVALSNGSEQN